MAFSSRRSSDVSRTICAYWRRFATLGTAAGEQLDGLGAAGRLERAGVRSASVTVTVSIGSLRS